MISLNLHIHDATACCLGPAIIQWSYHYSCWKLFALEIDSFLESVGSGAGENFCALQSCVLLRPLVWILYCNIFFYIVSCEMTGYGKWVCFFHYFEFSCRLSKCHLYCGVSQRGPTQWLGQSCSSPASLFLSVSDYSEVTQPNYDINLAILFYS